MDAKEIIKTDLKDFVDKNYTPFSWSVCLDRALVLKDGLKPIQRKILWTAKEMGITDKSAKVKVASFCGRVMKYSPHSVAESSVTNLAKSEGSSPPVDLRVPLIRIKGNINAAGRYIEMNFWPAAMELLKELNENTVLMVDNYDNTAKEPKFLPVRWPVAFINGVPNAMAVGFACNLPSHNPDEVMDACIKLLQNSDINITDITKIIKGPDFSCGCDIIKKRDGVDGVKEYMKTGSGTFIMRGVYEVKKEGRKHVINFSALPYKITPEKILESISSNYEKGKLRELSSWKDLSDLKHPVNVEIITKTNVNIDKVISDLFQLTPLEQTFSANNTLIINDKPLQADVKTILNSFLDLRKECTKNKLEYRLDKKKHKLLMQEAIQKVLLDIDAAIKIIRNSDNDKVAKEKLIKKFKLNDEQAEYILSLQLRKLTKADRHEIETSIKDLNKEIKELDSILNNKKKFIDFIIKELEDTKQVITSKRLCKIITELK